MPTKFASVYSNAFHCPRCGAYAHQHWYELRAQMVEPLRKPPPLISRGSVAVPQLDIVRVLQETPQPTSASRVEALRLSQCSACLTASVWLGQKLVVPTANRRHAVHAELSEDIKRDVIEADEIHQASPRGAAALLRVAIEKLCQELTGDKKSKLDELIGGLVGKGLDLRVQKMLDIVRVIGNDAVHPGVLDLRDDVETVQSLFQLVNEIAEEMLAKPKRLEAMYGKLPETKRDGIEKRNAKAIDLAKADGSQDDSSGNDEAGPA